MQLQVASGPHGRLLGTVPIPAKPQAAAVPPPSRCTALPSTAGPLNNPIPFQSVPIPTPSSPVLVVSRGQARRIPSPGYFPVPRRASQAWCQDVTPARRDPSAVPLTGILLPRRSHNAQQLILLPFAATFNSLWSSNVLHKRLISKKANYFFITFKNLNFYFYKLTWVIVAMSREFIFKYYNFLP